MSEILAVSDGVVVSLAYTLFVDEKIEDSADANEPLEYIQGCHNLIPGLEKELEGMKIGDKKSVFVAPAEAYGEYDSEALVSIERNQFPEDFKPEKGFPLQLSDGESANVFTGIISDADENVVWVDLNHPLAGKELKFEVEIINLRIASQAEYEAGFVGADLENSCSAGCNGCAGSCCG